MMPAVHISATRGYGDCEDCGMYPYGQASMTFEGQAPLEMCYDGHLGGGTWDGENESLYLWALTKLGVVLTIAGKPIEVPTYYVNNYDRGYRDMVAQVLFEGEPRFIELATTRTIDEEDPEYSNLTGVVVPAIDSNIGTPSAPTVFEMKFSEDGEYVLESSWQGDWGPVYRCVLAAVCTLTEELSEVDDTSTDYADGAEGYDE